MPVSILYTTHPDEETAKRIGQALVEERLAACYNVHPMQSGYHWEGALLNEDEWVAILKTRPALVRAATDRILELHPYEIPAVLHWEVQANAAYEAWIIAETNNDLSEE